MISGGPTVHVATASSVKAVVGVGGIGVGIVVGVGLDGAHATKSSNIHIKPIIRSSFSRFIISPQGSYVIQKQTLGWVASFMQAG
jgi:hypothetical protein